MRYDTRFRDRSSFFNTGLPDGVKWLILVNVAIYFISFFGSIFAGDVLFQSLELRAYDLFRRGFIWQLVTYLFLHDISSIWHILFNMLALWMFGTPIEQTWGTKRFLQYYFVCGIGAGLCFAVSGVVMGDPYVRTLGASGAIFGLLLAFGILFAEQTILFAFLFPIKAKFAVMIYGAIEFLSAVRGGGTVNHLAHLGGMLFGYIYMKLQFGAPRRNLAGAARFGAAPPSSGKSGFDLQRWWKEYRLKQAKKKFQVYMKKHGGPGPFVN